jgi:uncharacterized protein (DUF1697 family)
VGPPNPGCTGRCGAPPVSLALGVKIQINHGIFNMTKYLLLLRGINVGGKNKIPMTKLRKCLEELGFTHVTTFIASGNVILESSKRPNEIKKETEKAIAGGFRIDSDVIKVLVLTRKQLQDIIDHKPKGFGEHPEKYHSDAIFLIDIEAKHAISLFNPREGVDKVWLGEGVIYSQRLSAMRTKSRLNKIMGTQEYKSMTIRNWNTTTTLLGLLLKNEK